MRARTSFLYIFIIFLKLTFSSFFEIEFMGEFLQFFCDLSDFIICLIILKLKDSHTLARFKYVSSFLFVHCVVFV